MVLYNKGITMTFKIRTGTRSSSKLGKQTGNRVRNRIHGTILQETGIVIYKKLLYEHETTLFTFVAIRLKPGTKMVKQLVVNAVNMSSLNTFVFGIVTVTQLAMTMKRSGALLLLCSNWEQTGSRNWPSTQYCCQALFFVRVGKPSVRHMSLTVITLSSTATVRFRLGTAMVK